MDVTKLRVYKQALEAFQLIEKIVKDLPLELFDTKRQILRSSKAIPPLIAEGFGRRRSQKELYRFVIEAMSSSDETITHLRIIAKSLFNKIPMEKLRTTAGVYKSVSKQLNKFASTIKFKSDL
ncbi:MAG: four helix bundle protein [Candidatus Levybacteria bacterium]|nr:four helix bundle protein [Candidatus Levybacteria bacterium]MBI3092707.1 four helix bundle protein [Candidatus Levybacteria bacterium]